MKIATLDMETDPFQYQRIPIPFACGFYDGETFHQTWGDQCVKQMLAFLKAYPHKLVIYAHNGGKFDYWFLAHALAEPLLFIDSRLAKAKLYHHEVRDSYKILPVALKQIQKDEIDYRFFERDKREKHKEKILEYLKSDCIYLYESVEAFVMQFGDVLTIGGAAIKDLQKDYKIKRISPEEDRIYREYFHGGRCECLEVGEIKSNKGFKLYDVNSLYPFCQSKFEHPIGSADYITDELPDNGFYLAHVCAESKGALPVRTKQGLSFPRGHIESFCTSHELRLAMKLGLAKITKVKEVYAWENTTNFERFVTRWIDYKIEREKAGDPKGRAIGKLIPNNAYGKFAQNPEKFKEYKLYDTIEACEEDGREFQGYIGERIIGSIPAKILPRMYKNVAVAASVTGAGRSIWLHALAAAQRPIYGDTDSIICEALPLKLDPFALGAWKLEAQMERVYVAGKKMYAAWTSKYNEPDHKLRTKNRWVEGFYKIDKGRRVPLKMASKGVIMPPEDVARVALGEEINVPIDAPSLRIGREAKFIARNIARTAEIA
ncbi:MAG: DNA polymerase [Phycisphaerae bacterium]